MSDKKYQSVAKFSAEDFGRVVVLYGGLSNEREVSLQSGAGVHQALLSKGIDAELVDVSTDLVEKLTKTKYDIAFIVLHGGDEEGGGIQALLEYLQIPYVGSGVNASMLCMNKLLSKQVFIQKSLPTLPFAAANLNNQDEVITALGLPMAIKPAVGGSTLGLSKVCTKDEYLPAIQLASTNSPCVIAEPWLTGTEYTIGIVADQALPAVRIQPTTEIYDFNAKYISEETGFFCPSGLDADVEALMQEYSLTAYKALGCRDWARMDFMMNAQGEMMLLEANTIPGMTSHSLVPMAAKAIGLSYADVVVEILSSAFARAQQSAHGNKTEQVLSYL